MNLKNERTKERKRGPSLKNLSLCTQNATFFQIKTKKKKRHQRLPLGKKGFI